MNDRAYKEQGIATTSDFASPVPGDYPDVARLIRPLLANTRLETAQLRYLNSPFHRYLHCARDRGTVAYVKEGRGTRVSRLRACGRPCCQLYRKSTSPKHLTSYGTPDSLRRLACNSTLQHLLCGGGCVLAP